MCFQNNTLAGSWPNFKQVGSWVIPLGAQNVAVPDLASHR